LSEFELYKNSGVQRVTQVQCQSVKGKSHVVNVHGLPKYYFDIYYSTIIAAHLEFQIERRMQAASYKHNTISSEKKDIFTAAEHI